LKETCGVGAYLRYVDDLALLDNDKRRLWELRDEIERFLVRERLRLHPHKQQVFPTHNGVDMLGYRVFPDHIRLRRDNGYRFRRRLRAKAAAYAAGELGLADVTHSVRAWIGHARHAHSVGLRKAVLGAVSFTRGAGRTMRPACVAGRRLEQPTEEPPLCEPQQEPRG